MRTDVERKVQWCLRQAAQSASGKRKRAAVQAPIDQIQYDGSGHIGSNDDGDADKSEACIGDDGHVHNVCDCSASCINRCIRRGLVNCGTQGAEVWNSQCFAYGPGESLWQ